MAIIERISELFRFGEPPSQLAIMREREVGAMLTLREQELQEYLSRSRPPGEEQNLWWRAKDVDGKTRSCHLYGTRGRLRQADCWWIEDEERGTMVTFGRNDRIKEIKMRSPSVGVLSQSRINIIATSDQLPPGPVRSARVDEMVIKPKPDGMLVGTVVSTETSFQFVRSASSETADGRWNFTLRMSNEGFMRGVVSWEGRKQSQFVYPNFDVARLTHAVLHEAFKEVIQPPP